MEVVPCRGGRAPCQNGVLSVNERFGILEVEGVREGTQLGREGGEEEDRRELTLKFANRVAGLDLAWVHSRIKISKVGCTL